MSKITQKKKIAKKKAKPRRVVQQITESVPETYGTRETTEPVVCPADCFIISAVALAEANKHLQKQGLWLTEDALLECEKPPQTPDDVRNEVKDAAELLLANGFYVYQDPPKLYNVLSSMLMDGVTFAGRTATQKTCDVMYDGTQINGDCVVRFTQELQPAVLAAFWGTLAALAVGTREEKLPIFVSVVASVRFGGEEGRGKLAVLQVTETVELSPVPKTDQSS